MSLLGVVGGLLLGAAGSAISGSGARAIKWHKPPSIEDFEKMVDEITGTQFVTTKGADGKVTQKLMRLPRTKEEEEDHQNLKKTVQGVMSNLRTLLDISPENKEKFGSLIGFLTDTQNNSKRNLLSVMGGDIPTQQKFQEDMNRFREAHTELLDDQWRRLRNAAEEKMIQDGHLDSSAAHEMRANLDRQEVLSRAENELKVEEYGNKLTGESFKRDFDIYNADRKQRLNDYEEKEKLRAKDDEIAEKEYTGELDVENRDIKKQGALLQMNQGVLDKEKAIEMQSIAPAMHQNAFANTFAQSEAINKQKMADYGIEKERHAASWRNNFGKSIANVAGDMTGAAMKQKGADGKMSSYDWWKDWSS